MHRPLATSLVLFIASVATLASSASAQVSEGSVYGPLPVFEFHSDFWVNLHHTLYQEAKFRGSTSAQTTDRDKAPSKNRPTLQISQTPKRRLPQPSSAPGTKPSTITPRTTSDKDLLFTTELILIKNQLGDFDGCDELSGRKKKTCDAGLPANFTHVLEIAAPVYRAHEWPGHDLANRRWVLRVAPLVREQGLGLSQRLADIYQTKWPKDKIRVDVCAYANRSGAYTTLDPLARHHLQH